MQFQLVMKFGGAALADGRAVRGACKIIAGARERRPVVVVSAHHGVTELLERCAHRAAEGVLDADPVRVRHRSLLAQLGQDPELLDRHFGELTDILRGIQAEGRLRSGELDFVLSFGERMSVRIVAAALRASGHPATPLDAFDLGLLSDSQHGRARPLPGIEAALRDSLGAVRGVPIVTGFLAKDPEGRLTTLGRNGSDLTAAIIAESVGAEELILWKDVPGIMTCDPALVPGARPIARMGLEEAAELAWLGAGILHPDALAPAARAGYRVRLKDVGDPSAPGTVLDAEPMGTRPVALAGSTDLAGITVHFDEAEPRVRALARLFGILEAERAEPRFVTVIAGAFSIYAPAGPAFQEVARAFGGKAHSNAPAAAAALVGGGGAASGARALEALLSAGVTVRSAFLGGRGPSQAFLLPPEELQRALRVLHAAFFEEPEPSARAGAPRHYGEAAPSGIPDQRAVKS